jgi:fructose-bisphosphate aldolase class 1
MQKTIASPGRGILAMDESNATCGKRLDSIGLENTEANRQAFRTLLSDSDMMAYIAMMAAPGRSLCLNQAISPMRGSMWNR